MGLVEPKRPVVLIAEDEFLLRMAAVDMIVAASFSGIPSGHPTRIPMSNCTSEARSFGLSRNDEG
jgi:hypothetical protein